MAEPEPSKVHYLFLFGELFRSPGGIERFNQSLLRAVSQCLPNARSTVLSLNDDSIPEPCPFPRNVELIPCAATSYRLLWKATLVMKALLRSLSDRPGLVVCGHLSLLPVCAVLKTFLGADYVVITHGIEAWKINGGWTRAALTKARKVLSVSPYTRSRIIEQLGVAPERVELLPNSVDGEQFRVQPKSAELMRRYGLGGHQVVLTVGRLSLADSYKGYEVVLRAFPQVLGVRPNVKYILVGAGEYLSFLQARSQQLGLGDTVIFTGFVPDAQLVDYYNLCDVFIMPSKGEGFGIVFLEALACGKPVIAGNQDGSRAALLDGQLGTLVNPDDVDAVAEAILNVLDGKVPGHLTNPAYLRNTVMENFGFGRFQERVQELFQQLR